MTDDALSDAQGDQNVALRIIDWILGAGVAIAALATWAIAGIVLFDVIARYLGSPTLWALEIAIYLLAVAAVFAAGEAVRTKTHFAVDILHSWLPSVTRRVLLVVIAVVSLILVSFVCYGFFQLVQMSAMLDIHSPTLLHIPLIYPQSVVAIGLAVLALGFARDILHLTRRRKSV